MDGGPERESAQPPTSDEIRGWLRLRLGKLLEIDASKIQDDEPLASYGLGSVDAVSLSGELEEWLGRPLAPTLAYEYPTIAAISDFLSTPAPARHTTHQGTAPVESGSNPSPVAIVGIGCRFPGANGPAAFWKLLRDGTDAIRTTPPE
jgi:acyl carrier protein